MEQVFSLTQELIISISVVVVGLLAVFVKAKISEVKSHVDSDKWYILENLSTVAVFAAEQMKLKMFIDDKLDYAEDVVQAGLDNYGIKLDARVIRAAIEKEVLVRFPKKGSK